MGEFASQVLRLPSIMVGIRRVDIHIAIVVCCIAFCTGLKLPSYIKACSVKDPNINDCALKSAQNLFKHTVIITGDRKYALPAMDPLLITELDINQNSLNIHYKNLKIYGLKNTQMTAMRLDIKNRHLEYDFVVPELLWVTKYSIEGKLLVVPIVGQGNNNMTLFNVKATMMQDFDLTTRKDGKQYIVVTKTKINSEMSGMKVVMEGLFNGDKTLGDHMNLFLNENWRDVSKELQPAFNEALAEVATSILNALAERVPYNEIFTDV